MDGELDVGLVAARVRRAKEGPRRDARGGKDRRGIALAVALELIAAVRVCFLEVITPGVQPAAHEVSAGAHPLHDRVHSIGEAAAHSRVVVDHVDAQLRERRAVADAREQEQLGRIDGTGGDDYLPRRPGVDAARVVGRVAPLDVLDARGAGSRVEQDAAHEAVGEHRHCLGT